MTVETSMLAAWERLRQIIGRSVELYIRGEVDQENGDGYDPEAGKVKNWPPIADPVRAFAVVSEGGAMRWPWHWTHDVVIESVDLVVQVKESELSAQIRLADIIELGGKQFEIASLGRFAFGVVECACKAVP